MVETKHRVTLRFDMSDFEKLSYWAEKEKMSLNEFIVHIMEQYIDIQNGNYQLPTLEIQRLNQLIESQYVISRDMKSLESIVINGFDSLLSLTRGDNYLIEHEDGEL